MNIKKIAINSTLALSLALSASPIGSLAATPSDVKGHWAETDISTMVDKGLIGGYPDGTFKPNKTISRAEFSAILNRALGYQTQNGSSFSDTTDHWASNDINTLFKHEIIQLADYHYTGKYEPNKEITRLEMTRMIARAIGNTKTADTSKFKDMDNATIGDLGHIAMAEEMGIIGGYSDGTFGPDKSATRAEASKMLNRMLNIKGEKPKEPNNVEPRVDSKVPSNMRLDVKNPKPTNPTDFSQNINALPLNNYQGKLESGIKVADINDIYANPSKAVQVGAVGAVRMELPPKDLELVKDDKSGYYFIISPELEDERFIYGGKIIKDGKIVEFMGYVGNSRYGAGKISEANILEADYIAFPKRGKQLIESNNWGDFVDVIFENPFKK